MPDDSTRRLLRIFGIAVTDCEDALSELEAALQASGVGAVPASALDAYERASGDSTGMADAEARLAKAAKLDAKFGEASLQLGILHAENGKLEQAVGDFQNAVAASPELAEAHMSLGCVRVAGYDWRNGLKEFNRALELNPNLAFAYELQAWTLNGLGRFNEAIAKTKKAIELDPLNPFYQMALSFFLYWARNYDKAIEQARETLEMDPNSAIAHVLLGLSFLKKGDTAGAIVEFQKAKAPNPGAWYQGYLGYTYAISGDRMKADQALHELEDLAKRQYVSPTAFATIYLGR